MKTTRGKSKKLWKTHFLLSKVRSLKLCPLAILMPLEENLYIVPHLKALISGQKFWVGQKCGSTISLWNTLMKISILLHKMAFQPIWKLATVVCERPFIFLHQIFQCQKGRGTNFFTNTYTLGPVITGSSTQDKWSVVTQNFCAKLN